MKKLNFFGEVLGLSPFKTRWKQTKVALFGQEDVPGSKFGLSSLAQFHPRVSPYLWRGKTYVPRQVIISNLVNHTPTPIANGWSVKMTQVQDYRGRRLTYDSHNGTDFSIPIGSEVCTAAPGQVVAIQSEFNRGGLKIFVDHGEGLMTCYAHLARPLVAVGEVLERGQPLALSGYSGLDALISFPFGIPHVHFNVWLNGEPIDPFPYGGHVSLWHNGELPTPANGGGAAFVASSYREEQVAALIAACKTETVRAELCTTQPLQQQAAAVIIHSNYYPTRFRERINVYDQTYERRPRLDLPFSAQAFDGVVFLDDL